jgi:hypothetical protein
MWYQLVQLQLMTVDGMPVETIARRVDVSPEWLAERLEAARLSLLQIPMLAEELDEA